MKDKKTLINNLVFLILTIVVHMGFYAVDDKINAIRCVVQHPNHKEIKVVNGSWNTPRTEKDLKDMERLLSENANHLPVTIVAFRQKAMSTYDADVSDMWFPLNHGNDELLRK